MAKQTLNTIKSWFKTGFKPTQQQFWDTWDSFWHKDEVIPAANIENLDTRFDEKADAEALASHIKDIQAHGLDQKAGLNKANHFTEGNIFEKNLQVNKLKLNDEIGFNLNLENKVQNPGFAAKLHFSAEVGTLSLKTTLPDQQSGADPVYNDTQMTINNAGDMTISGSLAAKELLLTTGDNFQQTIKPAATAAADTELTLPAASGTLARKEDIPVITAGNNINLSGTYPNIVINANGGGSASVISLTYEALTDLIDADGLIPGQEYMIADFRSTFVYITHTILPANEESPATESLYYGSETYSGPEEPLIVTATSTSAIHAAAKSITNPYDQIIYTVNNLNRGIWASTKGTIIRRTDTQRNNTADFDYRVTMYKTNDDEPQRALNLDKNCTVKALGRYEMLVPLVIRYMVNSTIISLEGDIMSSLYYSTLDMEYGRIISSNFSVYSSNIKGRLMYFNASVTGQDYINRVQAKLYGNYYVLDNTRVLTYLKDDNRTTFNIVSGQDGHLYLQQVINNTISLSPLTTTVPT